MKKNKVHKVTKAMFKKNPPLTIYMKTPCGCEGYAVSWNWEKVTCKRCIRMMYAALFDTLVWAIGVAILVAVGIAIEY